MNVLAVIPARGGSKGIVRKNLREVAGKPMVCWSIDAARACGLIGRVAVSTDDAHIAEVARAAGAHVIDRPAELARDETATEPVLIHAVDESDRNGFRAD